MHILGKTKLTDPNGSVTTFAYTRRPSVSGCSSFWDGSRVLTSLTRVTDPVSGSGPTWRFDYATPFQTKVTDPNSRTTAYSLDRKGRVTRAVDAAGNPAQTSCTATSLVASRTDALGAVGWPGYAWARPAFATAVEAL